ncbi:hypothetical protein [Catenulispora acidiphila]|uniref:hypothetical protein n=1 Tax=Catenulispora acidiphila TaxID=304895 RepID=UPI00019E080E|nr:hypothetical protein [Catenulispora acidiphila]
MLSSSTAQGRLLLFASVMAVLAMATGSALFTTALAVAVTVGWLAAGRQSLLEAAETELQHATQAVAAAARTSPAPVGFKNSAGAVTCDSTQLVRTR